MKYRKNITRPFGDAASIINMYFDMVKTNRILCRTFIYSQKSNLSLFVYGCHKTS